MHAPCLPGSSHSIRTQSITIRESLSLFLSRISAVLWFISSEGVRARRREHGNWLSASSSFGRGCRMWQCSAACGPSRAVDSLCISALTSRRYQRKEQQRLCDLFSSQDQEWDSIEYLDGVLVPSLFRFVFQKETCHVLTTWIWPRTGPVCTVYLNQLIVIGLLSILCILGYLWHYQWRRLRRQPLWTPECCSRGHWCRLCAGFVLDETTLPVWKPQASQNNIKSLQMIGSCGFLSFSQQCHIISLLLWWLRTASANALLCSVLF